MHDKQLLLSIDKCLPVFGRAMQVDPDGPSHHDRHLYRSGSIGQLSTPHVLAAKGDIRMEAVDRSRYPSGHSMRSRKASRAEYHEDLKPILENVRTLWIF